MPTFQLKFGDNVQLNLPTKDLMNFIPDKKNIANMLIDKLGSDHEDNNDG